jgi:hypothetical protein
MPYGGFPAAGLSSSARSTLALSEREEGCAEEQDHGECHGDLERQGSAGESLWAPLDANAGGRHAASTGHSLPPVPSANSKHNMRVISTGPPGPPWSHGFNPWVTQIMAG